MLDRAPGLARHDIEAVGSLQRVLTLCSLGVAFTGTSHHGSMGEHQISHWIDMFAGKRGNSQARPSGWGRIADHGAPAARPSGARRGAGGAADGRGRGRHDASLRPGARSSLHRGDAEDGARRTRLPPTSTESWPTSGRRCKRELAPMALPVATMERALRAAGGPTTPGRARPFARDMAGRRPLSARDSRPLVVRQSRGRCRAARRHPGRRAMMRPLAEFPRRGGTQASSASSPTSTTPSPPTAACRPPPTRRSSGCTMRGSPSCRSPGGPPAGAI